MIGFIELTLTDDVKTLIAIDTIRAVVCDGLDETANAYIETCFDSRHGSTGLTVKESYKQVKQKLETACEQTIAAYQYIFRKGANDV